MWTDRRALVAGICLSILCNALLLGIVAGSVWKERRDGFGPARPLVARPGVRALSPEDRRTFAEAMAPHRAALRAARDRHRAARQMAAADIAAASFDPARVTADFAALRQATAETQALEHAALVDALGGLSASARAGLVSTPRAK